MQSWLRNRLLLVPFVMLLATLIATWYAVRHARATTDAEIHERIKAIERTLAGPPTFRITLPILEQLKNLTGAEFCLINRDEVATTHAGLPVYNTAMAAKNHGDSFTGEPVMVDEAGYHYFEIALPQTHPNATARVIVYYPDSIRDVEIESAVRPVLWLGLGGGLLATLLSGYVAFRYAQAERQRLLSQVSDGLAHQLRNAATGARLAMQVAVTGDEVDRESLDVAARQLERVETILKQFLDQQVVRELTLQSWDLRDVIDSLVTLESPRAAHAGTKLEWRRPINAVRKAIDREQWSHLAANLLGNAIEAAGAGGTVILTLSDSEFTVSDTGPGPPPHLTDKLFEPFVTGKPGGIGLGLMVARQVAVAHGQRLDWRRRDETTVFRVSF
ncbi:hypothetical protein BH11PLA2_BH11PLA2_30400 [soil metagenome]